ncbi:MAG TPA: hypothetical protein V6C88_13730 [Chroococcidiopsis sp.]
MSSLAEFSKRLGQTLPQRRYRSFNGMFLAAAALPLVVVGAFNIAIDPYGAFNSPAIAGINQAKPEKFKQDMLVKAIEVTQKHPDLILLGSSRVQWGIDPHYPGFSEARSPYNLALQGVNMGEMRHYFDHALTNQPALKQVIIGLDELMFSEFNVDRPGFEPSRLSQRFLPVQDWLNMTLSIDALQASQRTLETNRDRPSAVDVGEFRVAPPIFVDGMLALSHSEPNPPSAAEFISNLSNRLRPDRSDGRYSDYRVAAEQMDHFRYIVETCRQRGIELKVFISPEHAMLFDAMNHYRFGSDIEQWKRELVKITPVWDFSGYNSITTETPRRQMTYYLDSSHYSPTTGRLILDRMFAKTSDAIPSDFGVLLTPSTIEAHLASVRAARDRWAAQHPDLAIAVRDIGHPSRP